jgi:hypothetical protein
MASQYVSWNDSKVEPKVPDEEKKIQGVCDVINKVQERNFTHHRHGLRGTHVKTQAIVKGILTVEKDLPQHLAQGIFSKGGKTYSIGMAMQTSLASCRMIAHRDREDVG